MTIRLTYWNSLKEHALELSKTRLVDVGLFGHLLPLSLKFLVGHVSSATRSAISSRPITPEVFPDSRTRRSQYPEIRQGVHQCPPQRRSHGFFFRPATSRSAQPSRFH